MHVNADELYNFWVASGVSEEDIKNLAIEIRQLYLKYKSEGDKDAANRSIQEAIENKCLLEYLLTQGFIYNPGLW